MQFMGLRSAFPSQICAKERKESKMHQRKPVSLGIIGTAFLCAALSTNLMANQKLIAEGEKLYNQNCIFCHQADAIGKPGVAPSLTNAEFLATASDKFILTTIRDGREGTAMIPYAHLGKQKIEAILSYLRDHQTIKNYSAKIDAQPNAHGGDPRLGKQWYDQICSTCHGPEGNGYQAGGSGTAVGKAGFLRVASDGFIRETIKEGRSNTRMLPFQGPEAMADLSDREIDDIISYLRTLQ